MQSTNPYLCKIPTQEAIEAMTDLSSTAYKLLIYYYSKSSGWEFNDITMSEEIGVKLRALQNARKELIDKKYLHINKSPALDNYFVGKKCVFDWTHPQELADD